MAAQKPIGLDERFVQQMQNQLGAESTAFLSVLETESPTSILINPTKDPGHVFDYPKSVPWCKNGRYLDPRPDFTFDPLFHAGCYYVMEASSMFLHHVMSSLLENDKPVCALDLCAAPGGKSVIALSCLPPGSVLVSNEVHKTRFQTLQYNIDKWGAPNVIRTSLDPNRIPWSGLFDLILVDAPCSGEGLFRKDKEARYEWSPDHVIHCSARQRRILAEAERLLAPGGFIIYSTCTYNDEENMHQVQWLKKQFALTSKKIPIDDEWNITTKTMGNEIGFQCYPHKVRGEGFFCAVMQKSTDGPSNQAPEKRRSREHTSIIVETKPPKSLANWITLDDHNGPWRFFESIDKEVYVLQSSIDHDWLSHGLVRYPGVEIFSSSLSFRVNEVSRETPSHALALSSCLHPNVPSIHLDRDQAIRYLRKESVITDSSNSGWHVARYKGFALGWLKHTQAGLKNYLPTKYRIIKQEVR